MILDQPPYRTIPEQAAPPALPGRRQLFADPTFGTRLIQLTDATDGHVNRISYGIWPAWGIPASDGTVYILIQCDELFKIVTANPLTGQWGDVALPASFQGSDATWSHSAAEEIYHRDGGSRLMRLNVLTGEDTVVWDAAPVFSGSPYLSRMSSSADDNVWCFGRQTVGYVNSGFTVLNVKTGALYSEPPSRVGQYFKVQIDASGRWMWNVGLASGMSEWWDLTLPNTQTPATFPGTGHSALFAGLQAEYNNTTNQDELVTLGGSYARGKLLTWPDWNITTEYSPFVQSLGYYACAASTLPGVPWGPFHDELLLVALDGSGQVKRLCHLHNLQTSDYASIAQPTGGYIYMPTLSPMLAFHSSYGATDGSRQVFLALCEPPAAPLVNRRVGLPDRRLTQLPGY